ncbi:RNA polymerase sigma factor [Streptomyces sp. ADI93-02]|uniref:RNA polymerase sigma factor n=1 Tax=Streptomyces sp. ADI93-02 TaxID=1522757 RepID=UPI000F5576A3|nr:RNA polymerase sigma factor [Streptomyces sp. ADI93-02]RPK33291.1 ECF RNA polymerase sigma factor SigW [Streptomyces sp. ADI93-02]
MLPYDVEPLARRAAIGDSQALEGLLHAIRPEVLRRCGRFLPNREDAEDAAQEVLLHVAQKIGTFEGRSLFSTWLHTVIANDARQKYRELKRRAAERSALHEAAIYRADPHTTSVIVGSRLNLLEALEHLERDHPALVAPLVYRDLCQMDYAEVAERTGLPLGTVKSRLHAGRKYVRQWMRANA